VTKGVKIRHKYKKQKKQGEKKRKKIFRFNEASQPGLHGDRQGKKPTKLYIPTMLTTPAMICPPTVIKQPHAAAGNETSTRSTFARRLL
jgi:hypothetical protein